jgi:hypothetical protein
MLLKVFALLLNPGNLIVAEFGVFSPIHRISGHFVGSRLVTLPIAVLVSTLESASGCPGAPTYTADWIHA